MLVVLGSWKCIKSKKRARGGPARQVDYCRPSHRLRSKTVAAQFILHTAGPPIAFTVARVFCRGYLVGALTPPAAMKRRDGDESAKTDVRNNLDRLVGELVGGVLLVGPGAKACRDEENLDLSCRHDGRRYPARTVAGTFAW
jgi:hypothetical protein